MKLNPPNTHVGPDSPASLRFGFFFYASFSGKDGGVVDEMQGWWDGAAQHFAGTSSRSALRGSEAGCNSPPPSLHVTLARIGTIISCEVESLFAGEEEADWLKIGTENLALKFFSDST